MKDVYLKRCDDYSYENIKKSFDNMIDDMGGLCKYIKPNTRVLIKPNLVMKKNPKENATTNPMLIKVICESLKEIGCTAIIAESPGGTYTKSVLKNLYKACEIDKLEGENVSLNYDTCDINIENDDMKILKSLTVIKPLDDVDHVISVCKLKTHSMATFTGGVKNLFGVVPGLLKAEYHFKMPDIKDFSNLLLDICVCVKPTLTIMDAVFGMEGYGPTAGTSRKIGLLMGSQNPYALDVIACRVINLNPQSVPTIQRSIERNFLNEDFSDIIVKGEKIEDFFIKDYKIPKIKSINFFDGKLPVFFQRRLNYIFNPKPIFKKDVCIGCGECKRVCPPHAIEMIENKPVVELDKCIRCFCCHELCPKKAVHIKKPIFFKIFR